MYMYIYIYISIYTFCYIYIYIYIMRKILQDNIKNIICKEEFSYKYDSMICILIPFFEKLFQKG